MAIDKRTAYWVVEHHVDKLSYETGITAAAAALQADDVVAFPTETVYGLGGNALSAEAVGKIFEAKGRPADNPLIVHIADRSQLDTLVDNVPQTAYRLMDAFWPGPLTIILPSQHHIPHTVTAGLTTVGVRMPEHPVARALIREAHRPLAAPSANRSGRPSPTSAGHVYTDMQGRIAGILDGGPTGVGVESTVIECQSDRVVILRPGGVTKEALQKMVDEPVVDTNQLSAATAPKSPGMKYRHYAPKASLFLVKGSRQFLQQTVDERRRQGIKVGVLTTEENVTTYQADTVLSSGSRQDLQTVSRSLYQVLRMFDEKDVQEIYSETFPESGLGAAIMNRLNKSAGGAYLYE